MSVSSGDESWSTSEDNSSGNEYSVKTKIDKKSEDKQRSLKRKHKHKKHKSKHKKHKSKKKDDADGGEDSDKEIYKKIKTEDNEKRDKESSKKELLSTLKTTSVQPVNILPAILNMTSEKDSNKETISKGTGKDLLKDILKVINEQDISKLKNKEKKDEKDKRKSRSRSREKSRRRSRSKSKSKRSRSRDKSQRKSRSRSTDRRKDDRLSRNRDRRRSSRSRSKDRKRSRSRDKNRRKSRSKSRDRTQRRSRSKSPDRNQQHRSKSRDRYQQRRSKSKSRDRNQRRSRSKSRDHTQRRSTGKSRDRSQRSKSRERTDEHSGSKSKDRRSRRSRSRSQPRRSNWDLTYVPTEKTTTIYSTSSRHSGSRSERRSRSRSKERNTNLSEHKSKADSSVFSGTNPIKKSIDIKIPENLVVKTKLTPIGNGEEKTTLFGKWETVVETDTKGNKDIMNFTKLCLSISAKEGVEEDMEIDNDEVKEEPQITHHPFKVTPAPVYMPSQYHSRNIPTNPAQAIMAGMLNPLTGGGPMDRPITGPLEKHFPVSSGNDHRKREGDDVATPDAYQPVFEEAVVQDRPEEKIDVSAVIARRLGAQQLLNKNANDYSAKLVLAECDLKLKRWSDQSKKPGKFTGEIGVKMNKYQIAGAIETWVRKDFFHNLAPIQNNIGQRMMEKMGWEEGSPLGRGQEGFITPITIDVKVGRAGLLAADEEQLMRRSGGKNPKKRLMAQQIVNVNGKHPVSALSEVCAKRHLGVPTYDIVFEHGQAHSKNFLMKVTIQDTDYQSSVASPNKKHAKAQAALTALRILGVLTD